MDCFAEFVSSIMVAPGYKLTRYTRYDQCQVTTTLSAGKGWFALEATWLNLIS